MSVEVPDLLRDHVERFNAGVRTGDFGAMLERFTPDAELVFAGVPVGPFVGRQAIAEAYRSQPPDDEIEILDHQQQGDTILARYAWIRDEGVPAGEMWLETRDGLISRLTVTFETDGIG